MKGLVNRSFETMGRILVRAFTPDEKTVQRVANQWIEQHSWVEKQ
jgi:hypothetical protein